jgi:hypothetical protein
MKLFLAECFAFAGLLAFAILTIVPADAQTRDSGTPREPTTKEGKCAKANGGRWVPNRGWYTNDQIGYQNCLRR